MALFYSGQISADDCDAFTSLSGYGIIGEDDFSYGNNSTINTIDITGDTGNTPTPLGVMETVDEYFPDIDPSTFPSTGGSDLEYPSSVSAGSYGKVILKGNSTTTFSGGYDVGGTGGTYIYELEFKQKSGRGATASMAPGDYFIEKLSMANKSNIIVTGSGQVRLYIKESFQAGNEAKLNAGGNVEDFIIFLYDSASLQVGNGNSGHSDADFSGVIYTPYDTTSIQFGNNNDIQGAILSEGSVEVGSNTDFDYSSSVQESVLDAFGCEATASVDHYAITHAGVGVTCEAVVVTVTAHDASHAEVAPANGTEITLTTSPLVDSGSGSTYTFTGTETSTTFYLTETTATTSPHININVTDGTASEDASEDPALQFVNTALLFSSTTSQTSCENSATMTLRAIRTDDSTGACVARVTGDLAVDMAYACVDPTTCHGDKNDAVTIRALDTDGTTLLNSGSIADNPDDSVSDYISRTLRFDGSGVANFTASYSDAGEIALHAQLSLAASSPDPAITLSDSSESFVVAPESFKVESFKSDGTTALNNSGSSGAPSQVAGDAFQLKVVAQCSDGTVTKNYAWDTDISAVAPSSPDTGSGGTLGNVYFSSDDTKVYGDAGTTTSASASDFSDGVALLTNARYNEVGSVTFQANANDYLGDTSADTVGTTATEVGRFIPDRFILSAPTLTNRSDLAPTIPADFTYMDEALELGFTLTAVNAQGETTQNYEGSYAKLNPTSSGSLGLAAYDPVGGTDMSSRLDIGVSSGSWSSGSATISAEVAISRLASPDGIFEGLQFGVIPGDSDGVTLDSTTLDLDVDGDTTNDHAEIGDTDILFGRLNVLDTTGHESLPLPITLQAEYFDGSGFVTNDRDDSSLYNSTYGELDNYTDNLPTTSGEPTLSGSGTLSDGTGSGMSLSAPGSGNTGSVDLEYCLETCTNGTGGAGLGYLQYDWDGDGSHDDNPTGTARFGIYTGSDRQIYIEEIY
ncbi:hypothetical protein BOW53_13420 [Solemya pervernicosa gill symbiont]|uniref:MSHA biogenesis protein MshQ n=1 Tax=Solemya pervernicosa gill symbiont TaxID=642797 RepID=A0A1T2L1M4_9GAMM|nr:hypothetical protein BOW53_13420 [Solemya pervernicosa gill symbiont]